MHIARLLVLTWLISLAGHAHAGTTRSIDGLTFTQPEGFAWDALEGKNHVLLKFEEGNVYCAIAIYRARPRDANLAAQFQKDWQGIGRWERAAAPRERTVGATTSALEDSARAVIAGKDLYAEMIDVDAGSNVITVMIFAPSIEVLASFKQPIDAMLASFVVAHAEANSAERSRQVDLRYRVPAGWAQKNVTTAVRLERNSGRDPYSGYRFTLYILPSEPLRGNLRHTFLDIWQSQIKPQFDIPIAPLPMMRRLKSGLVCAYDGDLSRNKGGERPLAVLYVLAQGNRVVPIVGVFFGGGPAPERALNQDIEALIESAEVPGAGTGKVALYSASDLVGDWETSSSSHATYVTSSGAYSHDVSMAGGQGIVLKEDNTFHKIFGGVSQGTLVKHSDEGQWRIDDGYLLLDGQTMNRYQILGLGSDPQLGAFLVLSNYANIEQHNKDLVFPRRAGTGTWYKRKD